AQQQRRDGENAGAATVVEHGATGQWLTVEPFQAERRGGMGAGTEGEARIERQNYRVGIRRLAPAGANPEPLAEAHRLEVIHPGALPGAVFKTLNNAGW